MKLLEGVARMILFLPVALLATALVFAGTLIMCLVSPLAAASYASGPGNSTTPYKENEREAGNCTENGTSATPGGPGPAA